MTILTICLFVSSICSFSVLFQLYAIILVIFFLFFAFLFAYFSSFSASPPPTGSLLPLDHAAGQSTAPFHGATTEGEYYLMQHADEPHLRLMERKLLLEWSPSA